MKKKWSALLFAIGFQCVESPMTYPPFYFIRPSLEKSFEEKVLVKDRYSRLEKKEAALLRAPSLDSQQPLFRVLNQGSLVQPLREQSNQHLVRVLFNESYFGKLKKWVHSIHGNLELAAAREEGWVRNQNLATRGLQKTVFWSLMKRTGISMNGEQLVISEYAFLRLKHAESRFWKLNCGQQGSNWIAFVNQSNETVYLDESGLAGLMPIPAQDLAFVEKLYPKYELFKRSPIGFLNLPLTHQPDLQYMYGKNFYVGPRTHGVSQQGWDYVHHTSNDAPETDVWGKPRTIYQFFKLAQFWKKRCISGIDFNSSDLCGSSRSVACSTLFEREFQCTLQVNDVAYFSTGLKNANGLDPLGHRTHSTGYCIDVRPMRKDGRLLPSRWQGTEENSHELNKEFALVLKAFGASSIYYNDPELIKLNLTHFKEGHDDHFHFCLKTI